TGSLSPEAEAQIGDDLSGWPDLDTTKMLVEEDGDVNRFLVEVPDCRKGDMDSHASCSIRSTSDYTYCPNNEKARLVYFGRGDTASTTDFEFSGPSALREFLGGMVAESGDKFKVDNPSKDWLEAGVRPGVSFLMFSVSAIGNSELAKTNGVEVGD